MTQKNKMIVGGLIALLVLAAAYFLAPSETVDVATDDVTDQTMDVQSDLGALDTPNPLGEIVLGQADAPVTIVEYASLTCGHCSAFHVNTLPLIKEKYIAAGHVKIKFRPFPFDSFATAGAMLAQCVAPKQRVAFLDILFQRQGQWISSEKPIEAFQDISRQAGLSEDDFVVCLKDEKVLEGVRQMQKQATDDLGVRSTPTFFVNGTMLEGNQPFAEFEALINPLLPAGSVN